jgi:hypothetical protein
MVSMLVPFPIADEALDSSIAALVGDIYHFGQLPPVTHHMEEIPLIMDVENSCNHTLLLD